MKSTVLAIVIALSASSAFAQSRRPRIPGTRIPIPRVEVGRKCSVSMINNWHRVYQTYSGRIDVVTGDCSSAMRQCRNDLYRTRGSRGLRCVDNRYW